jgi:lipopolysaccharide export system permease protein
MLGDIATAKPAFDLKEGVFYDKIRGFAIKIGRKESNDSVIRDVIVYEQNNTLQDNFIIAKSGVMRISDNKRFLEFNLRDGWRYEERGDKYGSPRSDYIRLGFKEYKKQFDLSSFQIDWTNDSVNKNNERVYSMRQLDKAIDSLQRENKQFAHHLRTELYTSLPFVLYIDSIKRKEFPVDTAARVKKAKSFEELIPDSARQSIHDRALGDVTSLKASVEATMLNLKEKERNLRKHKIEWHRKIVLSLACLVLFLIGAPLGSIIRKGGLGTPLIFAIVFFMVFYFSTTTGEKFAKENTLTPFTGMWLATFLLVPVGIFLTYKAMRDSQLFNKEWYNRFVRTVRNAFRQNSNRGK